MSSNNGNDQLDWQGEIGTIQDRMKYLLNNSIQTDVQFLVGTGNEEKQLFKAHKLILLASSSIFAAQFHFDGSSASGQDDDAPINVIDISALAFNAMLNFIYANDLSLINKENFVDVYTAAKKYLLHGLVKKCIEMVEKMLDVKNVFGLLKIAKLHEEKILTDHCWEFIDKNIDFFGSVIKSLSRKEMDELLGQDTLQSNYEFNLFEYLRCWAEGQCEKEGINEPTVEQKRAEMGALLYQIRFPLISPMEFITEIVPAGILNNEEVAAMLIHYSDLEYVDDQTRAKHPIPFSDKARAKPPRENNKLADKYWVEEEKKILEKENNGLHGKLRIANQRLRACHQSEVH